MPTSISSAIASPASPRLLLKALKLVTYTTGTTPATGYVCLPSQNVLQPITVTNNTLAADPFKGSVKWTIHAYNAL